MTISATPGAVTSDGWQETAGASKVEREFAAANDGNVALTAEIDLRKGHGFTF